MSVQITRCLQIIELLAVSDEGLPLRSLANDVDITKPAAHRILATLTELGYVVQGEDNPNYYLSSRLPLLGLQYSQNLINYRQIQPILDKLANLTSELVQMTLATDRALYWIAAAQGTKSGLRFHANIGEKALLTSTAVGQAWLSTLSEERATQLALAEGFGLPEQLGPNAPRDLEALRASLSKARELGYAVVTDSAELGVSAVATPVYTDDSKHCVGTLGMATPSARTNEKMLHRFGKLMTQYAPRLSDSLDYAAVALSIKNAQQPSRLSDLRRELEIAE